MTKKNKTVKKREEEGKEEKEKTKEQENEEGEENHGILPDRNFKKNLGCGG